jgi:hypothetical protein
MFGMTPPGDRLEVLDGVVRQVLDQMRIDRERVDRGDTDGEAVARGAGDRLRADVPARARTVLTTFAVRELAELLAGAAIMSSCRRRIGNDDAATAETPT